MILIQSSKYLVLTQLRRFGWHGTNALFLVDNYLYRFHDLMAKRLSLVGYHHNLTYVSLPVAT